MIEDIKKVAIRGDIEAQFHLEVCYQNGMGVKRGHREAEKWARKAAEEGYAKAQIAVGMSYYTGEGLPKDHVKAYAWVNLVAAQGEEEAQDAVSQIRQQLYFSELTRAQQRAMELLSMTKSKREYTNPVSGIVGSSIAPNQLRRMFRPSRCLCYSSSPCQVFICF